MNVKKDGKLLTVSDRPYLLWAIGLAILLFSLLLVVRAANLLTTINGSGLLSILATATIFGAFGFWLVWKYPQINCKVDSETNELTRQIRWIYLERSEIFPLKQIKKVTLAEKYAWMGADTFEKYRPELVLLDGRQLPVSARWRHDREFCQAVADKINSAIRKRAQDEKRDEKIVEPEN